MCGKDSFDSLIESCDVYICFGVSAACILRYQSKSRESGKAVCDGGAGGMK